MRIQAARLIKKVKSGINEIRKILKKGGRLPLYFSDDKPTEPEGVRSDAPSGSYDGVINSLHKEADGYTEKSKKWGVCAWYCRLAAATLENIARSTPAGIVVDGADAEQTVTARTTRKRWRDGVRLLHFIISNLPGKPRIVYFALACKRLCSVVRRSTD